jgi:hypothetical protein
VPSQKTIFGVKMAFSKHTGTLTVQGVEVKVEITYNNTPNLRHHRMGIDSIEFGGHQYSPMEYDELVSHVVDDSSTVWTPPLPQ